MPNLNNAAVFIHFLQNQEGRPAVPDGLETVKNYALSRRDSAVQSAPAKAWLNLPFAERIALLSVAHHSLHAQTVVENALAQAQILRGDLKELVVR